MATPWNWIVLIGGIIVAIGMLVLWAVGCISYNEYRIVMFSATFLVIVVIIIRRNGDPIFGKRKK
jgi:hypothetical protein